MVYLPTKLGDFVRANVGKYSMHGADGNIIELDIFNEKKSLHLLPANEGSFQPGTKGGGWPLSQDLAVLGVGPGPESPRNIETSWTNKNGGLYHFFVDG